MTAKEQLKKPSSQIILGVLTLAIAGIAGGQFAGFKVEPVACDECGKSLAACEARETLISASLEEAKAAISQAYAESTP